GQVDAGQRPRRYHRHGDPGDPPRRRSGPAHHDLPDVGPAARRRSGPGHARPARGRPAGWRAEYCRTAWIELRRRAERRSYPDKPTSLEQLAVADRLIIRGAREHNLRDVNLDLPRHAMIVFTGLSGSGKSSLAFDTIFAEGQALRGV